MVFLKRAEPADTVPSMKRSVLAGALGATLLFSTVACGGSSDPNIVKAPASADDMEGHQYKGVVSDLKDAGFTNVETKKDEDLIVGWLDKPGEVEDVKINGSKDFDSGDEFKKDAKVVVRYHAFKDEDEPSDTPSPSESPTPSEKPSATASPQPVLPKIVTPQNNTDLAAFIKKDSCDPTLGKFIDAHQGQVFAFNASVIADPTPEDDDLEYWTMTVAPGDKGENSTEGPAFQMTGLASYDIQDVNTKVRIKGTFSEFDEDSCLVMVDADVVDGISLR